MSELEKIRAISFLSILTITLIVLFALQSRTDAPTPSAPEALQLCAISKGALCPDPSLGGVHSGAGNARAKRGALIVTSVQPTPTGYLVSGDAPVSMLGEMTVVAARLPTDRLADLGETRRVALHLARGRDVAASRTAQASEF